MPNPQHKKSQAKCEYCCMTVVVALAAILFAGCVAASIALMRKELEICWTRDCINTEAKFITSMDMRVDPCDDFYAYSCGGWIQNHFVPDGASRIDEFQILSELTMYNIKALLESGGPTLPKEPKELYRMCMDEDKLDKIGVEPLLKHLQYMGLPHVPSAEKRFLWPKAVEKAEKFLGDSIFFFLDVIPHPLNISNHVIQVRQGNFNSLFGADFPDDDRLQHVEDFCTNYIDLLVSHVPEANNKVNSKQMAKDLLTFHRQLRDIMTKSDAEEDRLKQFQQITLNQLQTITGSNSSIFVWSEYFNDVLSGLKDKLDKNSPIILRNWQYFEQWPQIMQNTNPETIELYIWWRISSSLAPHTMTEFREMSEKLMQKMSGNRDRVIHRWKTCVEMVNKAYGMTIGSAYTQKHFKASIQNEVVKIKDEIRNAIEDTLKKQDWMDEQTINLSLGKIRATEIIIGAPKEPQNSGEQNEFYPEVERMNIETLNKGFFEANLQLLAAFEEHKLRLLSEITQRNRKMFFSPPTDVNVFYDEETNLITLPAAILQPPFYDLGLEALNYGAIGALIAQQYIHALDNIGRQYDLNGNLNQSWSEETLTAYNKRYWCPVDQQNGFNGELPRGKFSSAQQVKNVAGVDGLREALKAFKNVQYKLNDMIVARHFAFPALNDYSEEQLFFLAFANMFCSREFKSIESSHNRLRVINTVSNMEEFSDLWHCPAGTKMNPVVKCSLW
ncbi:Hypothetical predicted protein [Cloeon dipterum]|uniref:Peptidase M13 N-terminal domain-containing protein n=1 Tax=Cloeon dipterum TaxID=197152 RepID=A0A8S1D706_9INSE|nr:Hypothetical predicted protein [Cloeon dipterum]